MMKKSENLEEYKVDRPFLTRKFVARFLTVFSSFLVLVSLLALPVIGLCSHDVEERNRGLYQQTMAHQLEQADIQLHSLAEQLQYFCGDDANFINLSNPAMELNYIALREFQLDLSNMLNGYSYVEDVVLVTRNDLIITSHLSAPNRAVMTKVFFEQFFITDALRTPADFRALGHSFHCLPITDHYRGEYLALTVCHPLFNDNAQLVAHALITLDLEKLLQVVVPEEFAQVAQVRVSHNEKELFVRAGNSLSQPVTLTVRGSHTGVQLEVTLPRNLLNQSIHSIMTAIWMLAGTALLGGLALTIVFILITGRPMRRLTQAARAFAPFIQAQNEYEYVEGTLSHLGRIMAQSREEIEQQRTVLRQKALEKAMMGGAVVREEFDMLFPDFPQHYRVVLVQIPLSEGAQNMVNLALSERLMLEHLLSDHFVKIAYCLPLSTGTAALVMPDGAEILEQLESLREAFMHHYQLPVNIFLGDSASGKNMLGEAYASAKYIQSLAAPYIEKRVWHRGNFPDQTSMTNIDYTVLQRLYEALFNGRRDKAADCLARLRTALPNPQGSSYSNRRTLEFIHSIFIRVKQERFELLCNIPLPFPDLQLPLAEYLNILEENVGLVCETLSQSDAQATSFDQAIVTWVDNNFTDPELYLKTVITHFKINEKALQAAMHNISGTSFSEYLENKRLTHAAALLNSTRLNVNEIGQQSGFALYNTFYKSFKRRYGCSPLEYRAQQEG